MRWRSGHNPQDLVILVQLLCRSLGVREVLGQGLVGLGKMGYLTALDLH
jgi:hypothetical protein